MAKQIRNMSELVKDVQKRLDSGNKTMFESLKNKGGSNLAEVVATKLKKVAELLQAYLKKYIRYYFDTYSPRIYSLEQYGYTPSNHERKTRRFENSVRVDVSRNSGRLCARVYFDDNEVWRDSIMGGQKGNILALLNDGYRVKNGRHRNTPHFGYFWGVHFVEAAIIEARNNPLFSGIEIIWEPKIDGYGMG